MFLVRFRLFLLLPLFATAVGCASSPSEPVAGLRFEEHAVPVPDGYLEKVAGDCMQYGKGDLEILEGQEVPSAVMTGDAPCFFPDHLSGGGAVLDFDADGLVDVVWTRSGGAGPVFLKNKGGFGFEDVTDIVASGLDLSGAVGAAVGDIDNDGDPDILFTTYVRRELLLLVNQGNGTFVEDGVARGMSAPSGQILFGASAVFADVDNDGWLDVHVNNYRQVEATRREGVNLTRLFRNLGGRGEPGFFEDVTDAAGVATRRKDGADLTFVSAFHDFDGDGNLDLYASGDYNTSRVFRNLGNWTFEDVTAKLRVTSEETAMGIAIGDLSGDGVPEVVLTSASEFPCSVETAENLMKRPFDQVSGNRVFSFAWDSQREVTNRYGMRDGGYGWGVVMADFANDGVLDVFQVGLYDAVTGVSNNDCRTTSSNHPVLRLWEGGADEDFPEVSERAGISQSGRPRSVLTADLDNDGDEDIVVFQARIPPRLFENTSSTGGVVRVKFDPSLHPQNAEVVATLADGRRIVRWATTQHGTFAGAYTDLLVGIGAAEKIDTLTVNVVGVPDPFEFTDVLPGSTVEVK